MKKYICLLICCIVFLSACKQEELEPYFKDSTVPTKVSNINVESLPGAVKIMYDLPNDKAISYIKASCMINGKLRESKASIFQNTITIEGFPDTTNYQVNLYSVNRSEISSEPVRVDVKPLLSPYLKVFKNLEIFSDFGGATVSFENPDEADLAITLIHIDSTGFWNNGETLYTKKMKGTLSQRNLDTIPITFGVYIRDRWNNTSDTLIQELKPLYEENLDRTKFRVWNLPTDEPSAFGWTLDKLWDGGFDEGQGFHTNGTGWPQWITFDLGVNAAKLSRFRYWQRKNYGLEFADRNIKKMEIWGSNDPNPDGLWDNSWTYLMTVESVKPSGLPMGQLSSEDIQLIADGEEFTFPSNIPPVKYIRLKILETWSGAKNQWFMMEVSFWGSKENK